MSTPKAANPVTTPKPGKWFEDPKAVGVMDQLGVKYTVGEFKLKDINRKETLDNCGRLGENVLDYLVEDYATGMKRGDAFPMPVWFDTDKGVIVVSGIHRCWAAMKAGLDKVTGYKITPEYYTPKILFPMAVMCNRKEGQGIRTAEAYLSAMRFVDQELMSAKEAAQCMGVRLETLHEKIRCQKLRNIGIQTGVVTAAKLSDSVLRKFNQFRTNNKIVVALMDCASRFGISEKEAGELVSAVAKGKSEEEQLALIAREMDSYEVSQGNRLPFKFPVRKSFMETLAKLRRIVEGKKLLSDLQLGSPEDESQVRSDWDIVHQTVDKLLGEGRAKPPARKRTSGT